METEQPRSGGPEVISLRDLSFSELEERLGRDGVRPVHAGALWAWIHRVADPGLAEEADLLPPLKRWLRAHLGNDCLLENPAVVETVGSRDGRTRKLLLRLGDGAEIETVVMGYPGRYTVCLSTQVGCAMGCVFCATGRMGFLRQLRVGEMIGQVLAARRLLGGPGEAGLRNVVLMGMGEPFHNYDAVMKALEVLSHSQGANVGPSRMTVSTVGVVPGIVRFADEGRPYNLAVSLHGTTDGERSRLIPVNRRWPLAQLMEACRHYTAVSGRRILFSWTLIEGENDTARHARELGGLLVGLKAHVNLIRLNPIDDYEGAAAGEEAALSFRGIIQEAGVPCTIRQRRGIDVGAGCGQLRVGRVIG